MPNWIFPLENAVLESKSERATGMLKISAAISCLILAQQSAFAGSIAVPLQWTVMTDVPGAKVDYPAGLFTSEAGPPPRGTGRVLQSDSHEARFMIYVEDNETRQSPASFVKSNLTIPESRIDYRRITDRFFAISGETDGRTFYSRCNFSRASGERVYCIFLSYRSGETRFWDDIVTRISLSLREDK
jgi:hypothetical protein